MPARWHDGSAPWVCLWWCLQRRPWAVRLKGCVPCAGSRRRPGAVSVLASVPRAVRAGTRGTCAPAEEPICCPTPCALRRGPPSSLWLPG